MSRFTPTRINTPCSLCDDTSGKCRSLDSGSLFLCMTHASRSDSVPGFQFLGLTKDGLWGKWKPESEHQITEQDRETWRLQQQVIRRQRQQQKQQQQAQSMPVAERDRHYRTLLAELDLHPDDRADLIRRGFTESQIQEGGFKSVVAGQRLSKAYPKNLPGIAPNKRSLVVAADGYLCPVRDSQGRIQGMQLRVRGASDNKYRWLSSTENPVNLPNGELPLAVFQCAALVDQAAIALVEGTGAKPFLAAQRLGLTVVGAAGGQWASSPEQLEAIAQGCSLTLIPDGGAVQNRHVMRQYAALADLYPDLTVLWWDQVERGTDIDEISEEQLSNVRFLSWGEFEAIAILHGVTIQPATEVIGSQSWSEGAIAPDPANYADYCEWEQEQDRIEQAEEAEAALNQLLSMIRRGTRKLRHLDLPKGFAPVKPADVVEYEPGNRLATWEHAIQGGFKYVLDNSGTGSGKSHDSGRVDPKQWKFERAWYISPEHRNPTTSTLADWADLEARHSGLTGDERGKARRITRADQEVIVQANCSRAGVIAILRAKNVEGADTDTACNTCPMLNGCKHFSGNGYGFKHQRKTALLNERIRAHPDSLPSPEEWDYSCEVGIMDEAGETFTTTKKLNVQLNDLNDLRVALLKADLYQQYQPVLDGLETLLTEPGGLWGRPHPEIVDTLRKLLPDEIDFDAIAQATAPDLNALTPPDEVDLTDFYRERDQELEALKTRYDTNVAELKRHKELAIIERSQNLFSGQTLEQLRSQVALEFKAKQQALRAHYDADVKGLKAKYYQEYKTLNRDVIKLTAQHSAQAADILSATVLKQWFSEFLSALLYGAPILHVQWSELRITLPDSRMRDIAQQLGAFIALDATLSREDLALKLGCSPKEILVCRQRQQEIPNQELIQVKDIGRLGMNRGKEQERRVAAIASHYRNIDPTTQVIDFKKFNADGAWWRDSRGVNDFITCKTLLLVGTPCRNINDLFAEYSLLTGCQNLEDSQFKNYVDRKIRADIQQGVGRPRADRRPDERIQVIILSDFDLGMFTTQVNAVDICPEAGSKLDQFIAAAKGAIAQLQEEGQKITQTAIAKIAGYSQGYISRHWKLLQMLLNSSNSVCNNSVVSEEVVHLVERIATENGSDVIVECLEQGLYDSIRLKYWQDICRRISDRARIALLSSLVRSLPIPILQEVVDRERVFVCSDAQKLPNV